MITTTLLGCFRECSGVSVESPYPRTCLKMAAPLLKFDDGSGGYPANCFPVRTLVHRADEGMVINEHEVHWNCYVEMIA